MLFQVIRHTLFGLFGQVNITENYQYQILFILFIGIFLNGQFNLMVQFHGLVDGQWNFLEGQLGYKFQNSYKTQTQTGHPQDHKLQPQTSQQPRTQPHTMPISFITPPPTSLYQSLFSLLTLPSSRHPTTRPPSHTLFDLIESLPQATKQQQLTKANYFCMLSIAQSHKLQEITQVLRNSIEEYWTVFGTENNLSETYKTHRFVLLMLRWSLVVCRVGRGNIRKEGEEGRKQENSESDVCNRIPFSDDHTHLQQELHNILTEHLGEFHILKKMTDRPEQLQSILQNYQLILYHVFHLLQLLALTQNDQQKVQLYMKAFERIRRKSNIQIVHSQQGENKEKGENKEVQASMRVFRVVENTDTVYGINGNKTEPQNQPPKKRKDFKMTTTKGSVLKMKLQKRLSYASEQNQKQNCPF